MSGSKSLVKQDDRKRKVRSGCITCKRRRIKCDEALPACKQCIKSRRNCEGYSHFVIFANTGQGQRWLDSARCTPSPKSSLGTGSSDALAKPLESQAYGVYIDFSAAFGGSFDKPFWHNLALQVARQEPAIRHAVVALGCFGRHALQRQSLETRKLCSCSSCRLGLGSYNDALACVSDLSFPGDKTPIALLACVLFIAIETIRGNYLAVRTLTATGVRLLDEKAESMRGVSILKDLSPTFDRLRLPMSFSGQYSGLSPELSRPASSKHLKSASLQDLRNTLFPLLTDSHRLINTILQAKWTHWTDHDLPGLYAHRTKLLSHLDSWSTTFQAYLFTPKAISHTTTERYTATVLSSFHLVTSTWLSCVFSTSPDIYATHTSVFANLLRDAATVMQPRSAPSGTNSVREPCQTPISSFELGLLLPLYFTASKCRAPQLRRQAIQLLRLGPATEGTWIRDQQVAIAERIMELEEETLLADGSYARLFDHVNFYPGPREGTSRLVMRWYEDGELRSVEEVLDVERKSSTGF